MKNAKAKLSKESLKEAIVSITHFFAFVFVGGFNLKIILIWIAAEIGAGMLYGLIKGFFFDYFED